MLSEREVSAAVGSTAYGSDGDRLGTVEHFFVDDRTGAPTWASVITGLFGTRHSVVPAVDATFDEHDGTLRLPVTAGAVKSAPQLAGDHLDPSEEAELRRHYGIAAPGTADQGTADQGMAEQGVADQGMADQGVADQTVTQEIPAVPPPPAAPAVHGTAQDHGGMTRSEERLVVGTERVATSRARLVKYVVTEEVQITVPIRREEIRVEEVPLDAADPGPGESLLPADQLPSGEHLAAGGHRTGEYDTEGHQPAEGLPDEVVLHTERPVVSVEVVPVERVRLRIGTVAGQERITEQVQREQIVPEESPSPRVSPR